MKLFVFLALSLSAAAADYYVSTKGNDVAPGTIDQPWRTIQKAANTLAPGDTAWARQGRYRERVTVAISGSSPDHFVNFRVFPGERAVIDGSRLSVPADEDSALFLIANRSFVRVQGFELCNYRATRGNRVPCGVLITGECDHVEIRDCNIHHIRYHAKNGTAFGLAVYGTSAAKPISRVIIDGNQIHHCQLGNSESLTLNGNVVDCDVTNNRVHDNNNIGIVFIGFEETCPDPAQDQARDCVCRGNTVWNIKSYGNPAYGRHFSAGGIYVDGGTRILIEKNITHHCDIGIELASEHLGRATSHVEMRGNLIYQNRIGGLFLGGYDEQRGSTTSCFIHHNTFFANDTRRAGNGELYFEHFVTGNVITHNVFTAGRQGLLLGNATLTNSSNTLDYNLYFAVAGEDDSDWQWLNSTHTGFAAYRIATGNDAHSLFGDPLFLDARRLDFHLSAGSPAINAGDAAFIPASNETDFDRSRRIGGGVVDIGADEF